MGVGFLQFYRIEARAATNSAAISRGTSAVEALGQPISVMCVLLAILSLAFGIIRYYRVQQELIKNHFPAARVSMGVLVAVVAAVVVLVLALDIKITE